MSVLRAVAPILPVTSLSRALAFYRSLGFTTERYAGMEEYAFLLRDGFELHLRSALDLTEDNNPSGVYFFLQPGAAAALEAEFRAAGVAILSPLAIRDWKMNEFMLSDPDGNLLRFGEPLSVRS